MRWRPQAELTSRSLPPSRLATAAIADVSRHCDCFTPLCYCHPCSEKCDNCVTSPRRLIEIRAQNRFGRMIIKLTNRERDTILAALRRWQSYPAAREADSIATNHGKHKPLDDGEIQRLCTRIIEMAGSGNGAPLRRHSNNGAGMRKDPKTAG